MRGAVVRGFRKNVGMWGWQKTFKARHSKKEGKWHPIEHVIRTWITENERDFFPLQEAGVTSCFMAARVEGYVQGIQFCKGLCLLRPQGPPNTQRRPIHRLHILGLCTAAGQSLDRHDRSSHNQSPCMRRGLQDVPHGGLGGLERNAESGGAPDLRTHRERVCRCIEIVGEGDVFPHQHRARTRMDRRKYRPCPVPYHHCHPPGPPGVPVPLQMASALQFLRGVPLAQKSHCHPLPLRRRIRHRRPGRH